MLNQHTERMHCCIRTRIGGCPLLIQRIESKDCGHSADSTGNLLGLGLVAVGKRLIASTDSVVDFRERAWDSEVVVERCFERRRPLTDFDIAELIDGTVHKRLDTTVARCRFLQSLLGVLQHGAVVRTTEVVTQLNRTNHGQDMRHGQHVAERLRHFFAGHCDPVVVHPVAGKAVAGCVRLRNLVFMMWELQVEAATVDVELRAQVVGGHGGALQVPARTAIAPRRRPRGLARLGRLPQREIVRTALARSVGLALLHLVDAVAGQAAVVTTFSL